MYIIEINGQYVQDISNGMPRFVFGKFGARQFYASGLNGMPQVFAKCAGLYCIETP